MFIGLSFARDEICWLLRHSSNPSPAHQKGSGGGSSSGGIGGKGSSGKSSDDLVDRQLPELLFHMEELRSLYYILIISKLI